MNTLLRRNELIRLSIELAGLDVHLGSRKILDDLTCTLSGRTIGLLGPNGAGKSTLINTLLGFHKPTRGTARVLGLDVQRDLDQIRSIIGFMPENDSFVAHMTAVALHPHDGRAFGAARRSGARTRP